MRNAGSGNSGGRNRGDRRPRLPASFQAQALVTWNLRAELFARGCVTTSKTGRNLLRLGRAEKGARMNAGKIRRYLRNAERILGLFEGKRHGHHRHHGRGHHGRRSGGVGNEVLRQILRRIR